MIIRRQTVDGEVHQIETRAAVAFRDGNARGVIAFIGRRGARHNTELVAHTVNRRPDRQPRYRRQSEP